MATEAMICATLFPIRSLTFGRNSVSFDSPNDRVNSFGVKSIVSSFPMRRCLMALALAVCGGIGVAHADIAFQSPSGNIRCEMTRGALLAVRCDLGVDVQSYTDRPASCEGDWGTTFGVDQTGRGRLVCVTEPDSVPEMSNVLPYGRRAILDGITCQSELSGVTCTNLEGGGFEVRRAEQRIF
jgi:hypothetical protein